MPFVTRSIDPSDDVGQGAIAFGRLMPRARPTGRAEGARPRAAECRAQGRRGRRTRSPTVRTGGSRLVRCLVLRRTLQYVHRRLQRRLIRNTAARRGGASTPASVPRLLLPLPLECLDPPDGVRGQIADEHQRVDPPYRRSLPPKPRFLRGSASSSRFWRSASSASLGRRRSWPCQSAKNAPPCPAASSASERARGRPSRPCLLAWSSGFMLPPFVSLGRDEVVPIAFAALAVALELLHHRRGTNCDACLCRAVSAISRTFSGGVSVPTCAASSPAIPNSSAVRDTQRPGQERGREFGPDERHWVCPHEVESPREFGIPREWREQRLEPVRCRRDDHHEHPRVARGNVQRLVERRKVGERSLRGGRRPAPG